VPWCDEAIVRVRRFAVSDLQLDRITHGLQRQGRQIDLSPKKFSLLELLLRHAGQPVSRPAIVEQVWKLNCDTMTNVVDVYINYLRRKVDVGFELPLIRTIRGVGYQTGAKVTPA
jgi:two-component system, OmpR family, response regulator